MESGQGDALGSLLQRSIRIPAQGATLGKPHAPCPRSEGTPHIAGSPTRARPMRRSFRTLESCHAHTQGVALGWYASPRRGDPLRQGRNRIPAKGDALGSRLQRSIRIPAQGATLGKPHAPCPRSEGTPHIAGSPTRARPMRRSFRTLESCHAHTQGVALGWYTSPRRGDPLRQGRNRIPAKGDALGSRLQRSIRIPARGATLGKLGSRLQRSIRIPAQGATLGKLGSRLQRSIRIPAQGATLGKPHAPCPRSEGTPHIAGSPTRARPLRRSFRTLESCHAHTQGVALGWYASPRRGDPLRQGRNRIPAKVDALGSRLQRSIRIPAQGATLGKPHAPCPRSEGTPHIAGSPTHARPMRRSFRTLESCHAHTQGVALGWYASPRRGDQRQALPALSKEGNGRILWDRA